MLDSHRSDAPKRSRPSLRRRLLNAIDHQQANGAALPWPWSASNNTDNAPSAKPAVLRKKRKDDPHSVFAPRAQSAERQVTAAAPHQQPLHNTLPRHSRFMSEPGGGDAGSNPSSGTYSSNELFTPLSEHPLEPAWDLHRLDGSSVFYTPLYSPVAEVPMPDHKDAPSFFPPGLDQFRRDSALSSRPVSPATFVTAASSPGADPHQPPQPQHDGARPHSSSDYYRLLRAAGNPWSPTGVSSPDTSHTHSRCSSQPNIAYEHPTRAHDAIALRPSQLALRHSMNRELPPLPPGEAEQEARDREQGAKDECAITDSSESESQGAPHTPRSPSDDEYLLAPGTFAQAVGQAEDLEERDAEEQESCDSGDCTHQVRRRSLPMPLAGVAQEDDDPPRTEESGKANMGRRLSLLSRAASLTRATSLKWKNVARRRRGRTRNAADDPRTHEQRYSE